MQNRYRKLRLRARRARRDFNYSYKPHPYVLPVLGFIGIFIISAIFFVSLGSRTVGAEDAKVVQLYIDGNHQTVPTRAATVGELLKRLNVELKEQDIVEPAKDTPIYNDDFQINVYKARPVTVVDGSHRTLIVSAQQSPRLIAEQAGYKTYPEDGVEFSRPDQFLRNGVLGEEIAIERATPMTINLYGNVIALRTRAKTVGDVFKEKHIKALPDDTVQPASLDTPVTANLAVFIVRTGKQVATVEEVIPPPEEIVQDPNLAQGTIMVREAGTPGKKIVTYEIELRNGTEVSRKPLQEVIAVEPVKKVIVRGVRSLFADYNADGIPARVFCGSPKQRNWKNINVQNAAIGRSLAAEQGWTGAEWDALLELFACESSWNHLAGNPLSGAYGIPQALPAAKMSVVADDYLSNPRTQLIWGITRYVKPRYGTPSAALRFHYANNWY